ncbi:MAG: hypothetical protein HS104_09380 [Polyangiaceae bacterium]|nr:hypothetical protein [Polyangiaceae bacterium]
MLPTFRRGKGFTEVDAPHDGATVVEIRAGGGGLVRLQATLVSVAVTVLTRPSRRASAGAV